LNSLRDIERILRLSKIVSAPRTLLIIVLARYGAKHPLGQFSITFLENYLDAAMTGKETMQCGETAVIRHKPIDMYHPVLEYASLFEDQTI
jgi:hypothetical protein